MDPSAAYQNLTQNLQGCLQSFQEESVQTFTKELTQTLHKHITLKLPQELLPALDKASLPNLQDELYLYLFRTVLQPAVMKCTETYHEHMRTLREKMLGVLADAESESKPKGPSEAPTGKSELQLALVAKEQQGDTGGAESPTTLAVALHEPNVSGVAGSLWEVVGGQDQGGITVRTGKDLDSPEEKERLSTGAFVMQVEEIENGRLPYKLVAGSGPKTGWVSLRLKKKAQLLVKKADVGALWAAYPTRYFSSAMGALPSTLIVFDWDDTLCPTTWIDEHLAYEDVEGDFAAELGLRDQLLRQEHIVKELLECAQSVGTVALVTLALRPWVGESIARYFPGMSDLMKNIHVVYARELEAEPPSNRNIDPLTELKKRAMLRAMEDLATPCPGAKAGTWESLVSIGDSNFEKNAAQALGDDCQKAGQLRWTKTVKLVDRPNAEQFIRQLQVLKQQLVNIIAHTGNAHVSSTDLMIGRVGSASDTKLKKFPGYKTRLRPARR